MSGTLSTLGVVAAFSGLFVVSAALSRVMIAVGIADMPNPRSSHDRPVPKAGGVAVAVAFVAGLGGLALADGAKAGDAPLGPFLVLAAATAAFGLIDDLRGLSARTKLAAQAALALGFSLAAAHVERITLPGLGTIGLGLWGHALTVLWIVGFMNAFNFMDGINGIAGGSAALAGVALAAIAQAAGAGLVATASLALIAATLGFLVYNFPRGRLFLGDTGSQFIAFVLAALAVMGSAKAGDKVSIFVVPMIFYPFLYDVAATLVHKLRAGRPLFAAHRDHHYQLLVRMGWSHARAAGLYFALVAAHGLAAWALQEADPATRILWMAAPLPAYMAWTAVLYRAARRARLAGFCDIPTDGGQERTYNKTYDKK